MRRNAPSKGGIPPVRNPLRFGIPIRNREIRRPDGDPGDEGY
jgi:hypothetical protein